MRSKSKRAILINTTVVMMAIGQSAVRAQNGLPAASTSINSIAAVVRGDQVLTERQHWHDFLKLAAKPDAVVTLKEFEGAFGQKAVHRGDVSFYDFYGIQGFVTLDLHGDRAARKAYPRRVSNLVTFDFLGALMTETCITRDQVLGDLQKVGWELRMDSPAKSIQGDIKEIYPADMPYGSYTLVKGTQGVLLFTYSSKTNCAKKVTMQSDKLEFDRVNHINASESAK